MWAGFNKFLLDSYYVFDIRGWAHYEHDMTSAFKVLTNTLEKEGWVE